MPEGTERAIGRLEGKLDALIESVAEQTRKSDQSRARTHGNMEKIRNDISENRRDVQDLKKEMDAAGPVIIEIKKWKERFIGMQMLWTILVASAGGALVAFWKWIAIKTGFGQ